MLIILRTQWKTLVTVSLKVLIRNRRHKCTLNSYNGFTNKSYLRHRIKVNLKVKSGDRHMQVINRNPMCT